MQKDSPTPVEIVDDDFPDIAEVDAKLVALAKRQQRGDPDQRLQPQPGRRAAGHPGPQHQLAGERGQAGRPARRGAPGPGHPGGQGGRPGRRLPRRRHDDRRRGRRPVHRQGPRRRRDPRPPDGRRADDLRPAAPRLTGPAGRRRPGPAPAGPCRRDRRRRGLVQPDGRGRQAAGADRRPAAARLDPRRARGRAGGRADRRRRRGRRRRRDRARRAWLPAKVVGGRRRRRAAARNPWRPGCAALDGRVDAGRRRRRTDRVVLVHDGARPARLAGPRRRGRPRPRPSTGRRSRSCRSSRRSSGSTATWWSRPSIGRRWRRPRRRRASGARCSRRLRPVPADGPETWTDEAALLEACRIPVHAIPGEPDEPQGDHARRPRAGRARPARRGRRPGSAIGDDSHPFGPGGPLALGGIAIDGAPRLHGHSDGDVALHAVADALLGRGRPGRPRPALPGRTGDAARDRQRRAPRRGRPRGWPTPGSGRRRSTSRSSPPGRASATGSRRCGRRSPSSLGVPVDRVNVKASTGNLAGAEGAGRGIAARAVAVVEPDPMTVRLLDTLTGRAARRSSRSSPATSGSTAAARPSTARPTSATSGRSCSPTCSSATSASAGCRVTWVDEHHRHRRQDHPRRGRGRRADRATWPTAGPSGSWPTPRRSG